MIRIILADDHPLIRTGLRTILQEEGELQLVGEADSGSALLELLPRVAADVLLLDISMPGPGFAGLMRQIRAGWPGLRVLVLSVQPEDQYAVSALRAGAAGYLSKEQSPERLIAAIRRVHAGGRFISPALVERLAEELSPDRIRPPHLTLSEREHQVLTLLGGGRTTKQIAAELGLSPKTVSTFRQRIRQKLRLTSDAELIRYALEHHLTA